jgi:dolichol-phosphate mannosyltransferase
MPTYNEAQNVQKALRGIFNAIRLHKPLVRPIDIHVLVVDDNSPDGTATFVEQYRLQDPRVHLLLREEKQGLGAAYIAGFKYALKHLNPDVIIEMDADGQHDPRDLPYLIGQIERGNDFVIGSRYVAGGRVAQGWQLHRRFTSACARMVTRTLLDLHDVEDCSGGYRAIRASLLREIDLDDLHVSGYAFQAVLLEEAKYQGGNVKEIPITFGTRHAGESKMGFKDMVEGGAVCMRIRTKRLFTRRQPRRNKLVMPMQRI